MSRLDKIETIVLLMMENRSFDHMLGHLSMGAYADRDDINGLVEPLEDDKYANGFALEPYYPHLMRDGGLSNDLPHDRAQIAQQLRKANVAGEYAMDGFAESYFTAYPNDRTTKPDSMGFLGPQDVPMTGFLADQYAVCDRWFASLPAGTQPNRLMAWTGTSKIDGNGLFPPRDELLIDWLERNRVRWRVYHSGPSFFLLFGDLAALGPNFRNIDRLAADVAKERPTDFPEVIIVEPSYGDTARITGKVANDYHAPNAVGPGELFLRRIYEALTCNPDRWAKTMLVVTFDEHGGFYDHEPPPPIPFKPPADASYQTPFESLGVRIPGLVVSPMVDSRPACHELFDHTSMLQLLAEKFTPRKAYSRAVALRAKAGIRSLSAALNRDTPRTDIPAAPDFATTVNVPLEVNKAPETAMEVVFEQAAYKMVEDHPKDTAQMYPEITHWVLSQKARPHP